MNKNKESKKYEILRDELLSYIRKHDLKPNDKLPTIKEIIKDSNFSYATVNRTLIEMENEGIITKHQGKGLFVNRIPSTSVVKQVALIIPAHFSDHKIFMHIMSGVRPVLESAGIGLLVSISKMSHQQEKETVDMLISKNIDGMIIFMEDHYMADFSHIQDLKKNKFPFVLIDRFIPEVDTDYVVVNNKDTMFRICSYLKYNRNCSKVLFVPDHESPSEITSSIEKTEGYLNALKVLYGNSDDSIILLDDLVKNVIRLSDTNKNLGICFNHDAMVSDFLKKLESLNIPLPANCHLFGYNNSYDPPRFPTVEQFNDQVGMKAAEILIEKMKNPDNNHTVHIKIEPKLILPDEKGNFAIEN